MSNDVHSVAPEMVVSFFKGIMPFNQLREEQLKSLARHCKIVIFFRKEPVFFLPEKQN